MPPMPGRVVSRRFIGREPELARVVDAVAASATGQATTVIVGGGAGMGVTRFVDEALDRIVGRPQPPLILRGQANGPVDPPWAAVLDALGPLLAERPGEEVDALLAHDARPILLGLPGMAERAERVAGPRASDLADPERRQPRALESLLRWLGRVAAERPIVLVLEDLHAADAATRSFATFMARIARDERIALVLTYQPDRLTREHPLRENLAVIEAGLRPPVRVDLAPLARREIAGLIEGIDGERPSASIVVLVAERSAGSPLVVEELVAARRELKSATLTGSLADLVAARLTRRSPECRRVLRLLAPAERPMDRARLARAAAEIEAQLTRGLPPRSTSLPRRGAGGLEGDLAAGLAEALEHGFVRAEADERLRIRHELVARAVVTDLLPTQRTRYRTALAAAFEDVPVVAAAHWRAAHRLPEAREAALEAGRLALRVEAPQDAMEALELGLDLTPAEAAERVIPADPDAIDPAALAVRDDDPADGGDRDVEAAQPGGAPNGDELTGDALTVLAIGQLAAEAAYAAMRPTRAVAYAESALAALSERRDRTAYAVLQARLGRYRVAAGDAAGATSALRKAAGVAPREPSIERARILALLAQERMIAGAFSDSERAAVGGARDRARPGRARGARGDPRDDDPGRGPGLGRRPGGGRAAAARGDRAGPRARPGRGVVAGRREHGGRAGAARAPGEAIDEAFADMAEARAMDLDAVYANLLGGNVAGILVDVGRWPEARDLSLRALDWSPAGVPFVNAILNLVIVEIESEAGEEAGRLLGRVLVELETGGDFQFAVPAYQATASYAMWSGDLADARRAAERGWARVRGTEDWVLMARMASTALEVEAAIVAEALEKRRIGDVAASRERAGRILAEAEAAVARARVDDDGTGRGEPDASVATARAFHARLQGRDDPAAWAELAGRWRDLGDPYREARARWHQAEAILGAATAGVVGLAWPDRRPRGPRRCPRAAGLGRRARDATARAAAPARAPPARRPRHDPALARGRRGARRARARARRARGPT